MPWMWPEGKIGDVVELLEILGEVILKIPWILPEGLDSALFDRVCLEPGPFSQA